MMMNELNMSNKIEIEGIEYNTEEFSPKALEILKYLTFSELKLREMSNRNALMIKAKNAYISDIKREVIKNKSGIDLSKLLED
jgi:hypothetical protein